MSAGAHEFALSDSPALSCARIGAEQEPVLVLEGAMRDPGRLVDYAAREVAFAPVFGPDGGYPGIRAPAPLNYVGALSRALDPVIRRAFGLDGVKLARAECSFSLVTLPPGALAPLQRVPHVDTVDPLQFAVLHYLCDPAFGGTAFYRHRVTGYESLTGKRLAGYEAARDEELKALGPDPAYIIGDTDHFVRTAAFEAAWDRVIVYRSRLLHSGRILAPERLSADPRHGRLTANIFLNYRRT